MRVFKNRCFARWARQENVPDTVLLQAATEIVAGQVEAALGGCLFKKRLSREGSGKRGGYRVLIGYKKPHVERIVFLYAFAKNTSGPIFQVKKRKP